MQKARTRSTSLCIAFLLSYFLLSLSLITKLSLWLDEIIDLHQIRDFNLSGLIERVPLNAGGVPLSYLVRQGFIHVFGYSTLVGRLPALVFSVVAGAGIFAIARECRLRWPLLPLLLLCVIPLQFRYALESRPYSQFLACGIWSTFVFLLQCRHRSVGLSVLYGVLAISGLYTQPFTIFIFIAHFLWLSVAREVPDRKRLLILTATPILVSVLAFLPWQFLLQRLQHQSGATKRYSPISPHTFALLLREFTGAGYLGSALLLSLAALGLKRIPNRLFWILCTVAPVVLAFLADWFFGYFFAIRQVIPMLAPLCLLAAAGIEELSSRKPAWAVVAGVSLVLVFLAGNIAFFRKSRENWESAARIASALPPDSCVVFLPASSLPLYTFFEPRLASRECPQSLDRFSRVAIARSPYATEQTQAFRLPPQFMRKRVWNQQGPVVELYATR